MRQKLRSEAPEIHVGSIIQFRNRSWEIVTIEVVRVEDKSWYNKVPKSNHQGRNSYGSLIEYSKLPEFKIL